MKRKIYNNTTEYVRAIHDINHYYVSFSYNLLNDQRLSLEEIAIIIMILKNNDSYILNMNYLMKTSKIGQISFYKAIRNLQKFGYLEKMRGYGTTKWIVREEGDQKQITANIIDNLQIINKVNTNN